MAYVPKDKMKIYNKKQGEKFKRYSAKIERNIAEEFDKKLDENNLTYTYWLRKNIDRYLKNL